MPESYTYPDCELRSSGMDLHLCSGALGPKVDAIIQRGACFTPAHIEAGGGASVAALVAGGGKLWIIASSAAAKRWLLATATSFAWLPRFLKLGYSIQNRGLRWCVQHVGDVMYVPPLATHLVLTFPIHQDVLGTTILLGGTYHLERDLAGIHGRKFTRTMRSMFPCGVRRGTRLTNSSIDNLTLGQVSKEPELVHLLQLRYYTGEMPRDKDYKKVERNRKRKGANLGSRSVRGFTLTVGEKDTRNEKMGERRRKSLGELLSAEAVLEKEE